MELRLAFIYAVIAVFVLSPAISDVAWSAVGLSALLAWVIDLLGAPGCAQRQVKGQFVFLVGGAVLTVLADAVQGLIWLELVILALMAFAGAAMVL